MYFGPFMGLLRLPLLPFGALLTTDITRFSVALATTIAAMGKLSVLLMIARSTRPTRATRTVLLLLAVTIPFSGLQLHMLLPSLYHEACSWGHVWNTIFIVAFFRAIIREKPEFTLASLSVMAVAAGCGLMTRASVGVGLYVGLGLIMAWICLQLLTAPAKDRRYCVLVPVFTSGAILAIFLVFVGVVNYGRWGNPFVFALNQVQIMVTDVAPYRLDVLQKYGDLASAMRRHLPFLLVFFGLCVAALLIITAAGSSYRYRGEVHMHLEFAALDGVLLLARNDGLRVRQIRVIATLAVVGVVTGHLLLICHNARHYGPAELSYTAPTMLHELYWSFQSVVRQFGELPRLDVGPL